MAPVKTREVREIDSQGARGQRGWPGEGGRARTVSRSEPVRFCPSDDMLGTYLKAVKSPPHTLEAVRLHLVGCPACRARIPCLRSALKLRHREERRSRLALGFIAGLAVAVVLWFGWVYYVELRVQRQEALVNLLDLKLHAQNLLAEAPPTEIRLSKGPDRSPSLGPLPNVPFANGKLAFTNGDALWRKRVHVLTRRYWELTRNDPKLASDIRDLGLLLVLADQPMEALVVLTADGSRPADPGFLNDLGAARLAAGQVAEAQADLRDALRLRPDYKQPAYNLALALERAGQRQQAAAQWLDYLGMDPRGEWASHAQRRLAGLN